TAVRPSDGTSSFLSASRRVDPIVFKPPHRRATRRSHSPKGLADSEDRTINVTARIPWIPTTGQRSQPSAAPATPATPRMTGDSRSLCGCPNRRPGIDAALRRGDLSGGGREGRLRRVLDEPGPTHVGPGREGFIIRRFRGRHIAKPQVGTV